MVSTLNIELNESLSIKNIAGTYLKSIFNQIENISGQKLPNTFEDEYRKKTFDLFITDLKPIEGIKDVLDQLNIPICVASSGPMKKLRVNLQTTGFIKYFNGNLFSSYDIRSWKPNPEIFIHSADKMGFHPADCLVVEDSVAGVIEAKRGGFDVCALTNPGNRESFENEEVLIIGQMNELLEVLR